MQGDGAAVAQLAYGDAHPVPVTDANDGVGLEVAQLAGATTVRACSSTFLEGLDTAVPESEAVSLAAAVLGG
jgi:hypothetical protein